MNKEAMKIMKMTPDEQFSRACSAQQQQCNSMRKEIGNLVSELSDIRHGGEPDLEQLSTIVEHMRQFMDGIHDCTETMVAIYLFHTEEMEDDLRKANDLLRGEYDDKR